MRGSAIVVIISAIITGVIIADIIANPKGTQAAANGIATVSKPPLNALLGKPS